MDCINLKQTFGDRYKVTYEEGRYSTDPWLMIIPCQNGHICPWGGEDLAACTDYPGRVAGRLKRLSFTEVAQDGDDGANVVFHVKHFDQVAEIMKPRKKIRISEEERQKRTERIARYRFEPAVENAREDQIGVPRA